MQYITSSNNRLIVRIKALKMRKYREKYRLFFTEGLKFVMEGIESGSHIVHIVISNSFFESEYYANYSNRLNNSNAILYMVPDQLFREISDTENPQGILAVAEIPQYEISSILHEDSLVVVLDEIQDPGNLGTILRTAHAAGFDAAIVLKGSVDAYNPKTIRSSAGSIFHIPVISCHDTRECMECLKEKGIRIYGTHIGAEKNHYQVRLDKGAAILIGNEARGLSEEIIKYVDETIKIPMPGGAESLNASVAAGIVIYESVRQRYHNS